MFKLLKNLRKREIILIIICFILVCGQVWLEIEMPEYMSEITMLVETPGSKMNDILQNGMSMVFCALFSLILSVIVGFITSEISAKFSMSIRRNLFKKITELDSNDVEKITVSSLVIRSTNGITQIQMISSMGLQLILKAPIMTIMLVVKFWQNDWKWGVFATLSMMIINLVISLIMIIVLPRYKKMQESTDRLNNVLKEKIRGIHVVKSFDAEEFEEEKFENINLELTGIQLKNQKSLAIKTPLLYLAMYWSVLGIYFAGAYVIKNAFTVDKLEIYGDIIVLASYVMQVIAIFLMLSNIISLIPRAKVSANRINEVLDRKVKIKNGNIKDIKGGINKIEFKNVSFKYYDSKEYILKDISFEVNSGESLIVFGNIGSGKTTIINLLLRFFDVDSGEILINDINIKEYDKEFLYEKIAYIPQKPVIFKNTLKSNILYGNNKKTSRFDKVVALVDKDNNEKILSKVISKNEINLSMGQKQKISIARAMMREPNVYIFDDAFSGMELTDEKEILTKLKKNDNNAIVINILEENKNLEWADKILFLNNGNIIGFGTHKELLENCEFYQETLSKEEM